MADEADKPTTRRRRVGPELLFTAEVAGLAAFAFTRPVLDSFGRSPEAFIAQHATQGDIIWFGLLVALVPALMAAVMGWFARLAARDRLVAAQAVIVGMLAGAGAWRMGQDQTSQSGSAVQLIGLGLVVGLLLGFLRWWPRTRDVVATFLRYGSAALVVFAGQFFVASPAGELAMGTSPVLNDARAQELAEALPDRPPSVLLVTFDALPTMSLLDGEGSIDEELFPSFGALAEDATFYRNHTTVAPYTMQAVPALLTGRQPQPGSDIALDEQENLFTWLSGAYNLQVGEVATRMCPTDLCQLTEEASVGALLDDAVQWWVGGLDDPEERQSELVGASTPERYDKAEAWIEGLSFGRTSRPDLTFAHLLLPHEPWVYTDDGTPYETDDRPTGVDLRWSAGGMDVGEQRHILMTQAADRLLGQLLDKLHDSDAYDDTMVIVTADHGASFTSGMSQRGLAAGNIAEIAWSPLLIKPPGQANGAHDDRNVQLNDVLPTIADELGVPVPWEVDGFPVDQSGVERGDVKTLTTGLHDEIEPEPGQDHLFIDSADYLPDILTYSPPTGTGTDGAWKLTDHGDLFGRELTDLALETEASGEVMIESSEDLDAVDLDEPLRLEVVAGTDLPEGSVVAFALNGTIGALGEVQPLNKDPGLLVHGLLPPDLFVDGDNELAVYQVRGDVGDEVLHPLTLG
jgi:hypothetical protein